MLPEWMKDRYEQYLISKYIKIIELLKWLKGDEYLKKLFFVTRVCYDKELSSKLQAGIELKAMDKVK